MEASLIFWFDLRVTMKLSRMGSRCSLQAITLNITSQNQAWINLEVFKVVILGKNLEYGYY